MGRIFKDAGGRIGYRREEEAAEFPLPEGATEVIEVDFEANSAVLELLNREISRFRLDGGILYQDEAAIVFAPDTERRALRRSATSLNGKRIADLTNAEFRLLVALLTAQAGWLGRDGTLRL